MVHEAVPKVELHSHLIGVLNARLLADVRGAGHGVLVEPDAVRPVAHGEGPKGFADWLDRVAPYKGADWRTYLPVLGRHIEDLVDQGAVYAEIMISPLMFPRDVEAAADSFSEFRSWTTAAEGGRIQIEFLFLLPRSLPEELIDPDIARCVRLSQPGGICGVALAGLESEFPASRFLRLFRALADRGLGIEVHAGELGGADEVAEALDLGLPVRIGHGIAAFSDPRLVQRLGDENVHIEFCPTSNLKMGAASDLASHPIGRARDLGLNFSINTDDPGAFDCTLEGEFALVEKAFAFTRADFERVAMNSLEARFCRSLRGPARLLGRKHTKKAEARPVREALLVPV